MRVPAEAMQAIEGLQAEQRLARVHIAHTAEAARRKDILHVEAPAAGDRTAEPDIAAAAGTVAGVGTVVADAAASVKCVVDPR